MSSNTPVNPKRLILCCDGTWQNSDTGYVKPTFWNPIGKLQTPSNVTRISRSFRRLCKDSRVQIIEYVTGVGSTGGLTDMITGGAFGLGISENIREAYSFVCANYTDGDEIILVGFSRGAFTARSVAGMIGDLGLLTREGMEFFYPIFKDMQNFRTPNYKDPFPNMPFDNKPTGEHAAEKYREMLVERGLSRVNQNKGKGDLIKVKAVAVWDTVGSLGIPNVSWLTRIRRHPPKERFYDTNLSDRIEYAFQALALDEHRPPFSPSVWERTRSNRHVTELRQVWFAGNHGNVGGGWQDTGIANMSLAWMMDQLASIGVEFDEGTIARIFTRLVRYYRDQAVENDNKKVPPPIQSTDPEASATAPDDDVENGTCNFCPPVRNFLSRRKWAIAPIYDDNAPVRPWGLGQLLRPGGLLDKLSGYNMRTPGLYKKPDPKTGDPTRAFLEDTNERIHSSVRVRLAVGGLGLNDKKVWNAPALKGKWRLVRTKLEYLDPIPGTLATWEPEKLVAEAEAAAATNQVSDGSSTVTGTTATVVNGGGVPKAQSLVAQAAELQRPLSPVLRRKERWVWEYCGPEAQAPPERLLIEEPLGPYERQLVRLAGGTPNVYEFADGINVEF